MITSKAANGYHFKTGQPKAPREEPQCCTLLAVVQASRIFKWYRPDLTLHAQPSDLGQVCQTC